MLETIVMVLVVLWLLGLVSSYTMGGLIHLLLVLAILLAVIRVLRGRSLWSVGRVDEGGGSRRATARPRTARAGFGAPPSIRLALDESFTMDSLPGLAPAAESPAMLPGRDAGAWR